MTFLPRSRPRWLDALCFALCFCSLFAPSLQARYFTGQDADGNRIFLDDARKPALFTQDFGDCLGSSVVNVSRFDAAYYKDNMTVVFHLKGSTSIRNESLMLYIGVFAYGESRFDLTFNPCNANINSLCPMRGGVPIEANGIIPVAPVDVANIPPIALTIPDFEGQAILRIFANSTQSQIGCYSALVTNGSTLSHPQAVGAVLGFFAVVAVVASLATALYGEDVPTTRTHYAHSLSVGVVFAVLHHIYFSGALSMDWPSVLPAFWSNFAWAAGMIYSPGMQRSINNFLRTNQGNASAVGAAAPGRSTGNGQSFLLLESIYQLAPSSPSPPPPPPTRRDLGAAVAPSLGRRSVATTLVRRANANATDDFAWYGQPIKSGLPLPGDFYGFRGTLAQQDIPDSNAFLTGLLWLLVLLLVVAAAIVALKWTLELGCRIKLVKKDRLASFRSNWVRFTWQAVLRVLFIAFFMMMVLTMFQFAYRGPAKIIAIAAVIFLIVFVGAFATAAYACYARLRYGRYEVKPDRLRLRRKTLWKHIPWIEISRDGKKDEGSAEQEQAQLSTRFSIPWRTIRYIDDDDDRTTVHNDTAYILRFGWLAARFRRTRWWFFTVWLAYEFVRACFVGGAVRSPRAQLFGLLIVEIVALIAIVWMRPFEGARLNALLVYLLGFSKVATVALSAAFDAGFNLARIQTTVVGIVIVIIQGVLTIALLVAIVLGAVSSYWSVMRNREQIKPRSWTPMREKYFKHLDKTAADLPPPPPSPPPPPAPEVPLSPYFAVSSIRRQPKIEDEDAEFMAELNDASASRLSVVPNSIRGSRANSVMSLGGVSLGGAPFGARVHRASWSTQDLNTLRASEAPRASVSLHNSGSYGSGVALAGPSAGPSHPARGHTPTMSQPTISEQDAVTEV